MKPKADGFRSGFVSIVGEPNVGKSTLLNAILGEKLSIVTPKPQTTRNNITGIVTTENYQIVLLDTPGMLHPRYRLQEYMVEQIEKAIADCDVIVLMVDVSRSRRSEIEEKMIERLSSAQQPKILAMNKIDLIAKERLLPLIAEYSRRADFTDIVPISALKNDGVDELIEVIAEALPEGVPFYPEDQISDMPIRFFAAETIREKVFLLTRQEIPYASSVLIDDFREGETVHIRATIFIERDSQKGIIIGKGGEMLKRIGSEARKEIETFIGQPVYLELWVKVRKKWRENPRDLRELGYQSS